MSSPGLKLPSPPHRHSTPERRLPHRYLAAVPLSRLRPYLAGLKHLPLTRSAGPRLCKLRTLSSGRPRRPGHLVPEYFLRSQPPATTSITSAYVERAASPVS